MVLARANRMRIPARFYLAIVMVLLVLAACQPPYHRVETGGTDRILARLDKNATVLIMTPKDAVGEKQTYKSSGEAVARVIDTSMSRYARLVDVSPTPYVSYDQLKDTITKNSYGYIVVPTILKWQPKDDWYWPVNEVSVKVSVLDALTGAEISSNILKGKGTVEADYNPISIYPAGPVQLLGQPVDEYMDLLYR